MPYTVTLAPRGWRGDTFERAIALMKAGPPVNGKPGPAIPMPDPDVQAIMATWPVMEAQFRPSAESATVLISLTSVHVDPLTGKPDLRIERAYTLADGSTGPALVLFFQPQHTAVAFDDCSWDVQFSGPSARPQTWISGDGWGIDQDTTRTAADTVSP